MVIIVLPGAGRKKSARQLEWVGPVRPIDGRPPVSGRRLWAACLSWPLVAGPAGRRRQAETKPGVGGAARA